MKFKMDFTGVEKLEMTIYNAHSKTVEQANKVTRNNGERLKRKAKEEAPVEFYFLQEQIVSRHSPLTATVHAQAIYSGYQEYGTRFMSEQPYMKPALLWVQPKYQRDMTDVMKGVFE